MRKEMKVKFWAAGVSLAIFGLIWGSPMTAHATSIGEVQSNINKHQNEMDKWNDKASQLEDEQDLIEEQISDLNAEIINTMACIELKEEEIAAKENQISEKIVQIELTQAAYEAAVIREENQRNSMREYTRLTYENKEVTYFSALLSGKGFSEALNLMDNVEKVYTYNLTRLNAYINTKTEVQQLWDQLEIDKTTLETDKVGLEEDRAELAALKTDLDSKLAIKKKESANYDAEIKKAKNAAAAAKKQLAADKAKLKELQAAASKPAKNITVTNTNYASITDGATGSELGKKIAKYGCQYIGNPYVMGGTSLTNGADCSGFTYRIYSDFGYTIPRTSTQQRSAGTGVAYADAQPGDLICYSGHVGMYIGGGLIVHASNKKTGIKVSNAQYRTILAVRRILN